MNPNSIAKTSEFIQQKLHCESAKIALILGSGLGDFADSLNNKVTLPYKDIPNFPQSSVKGHKGQLVYGTVDEVPLLVFQGRFHYYEGYSLEETTFPIRVLKNLGIEALLVTNSAGGINSSFKVGDFMLIKDHLNLMGNNPLMGKNMDDYGPRFVDMTHTYDQIFRTKAKNLAKKMNLSLHEGIYAAFSGPTYETPAEVNMAKNLGADAVGMSTVPEVIVAKHQNMKILGLSCITNMAASTETHSINHHEVLQTTQKISKTFGQFMKSLVIMITHG